MLLSRVEAPHLPWQVVGTLTRNRVLVDGAAEEAAIEILAEATPLQARALEFASVSPLAT